MYNKDEILALNDVELNRLELVIIGERNRRECIEAHAKADIHRKEKKELRKVLTRLAKVYFGDEQDLKIRNLKQECLIAIEFKNRRENDVQQFLERYKLEKVLCRNGNSYSRSTNAIKLRSGRKSGAVISALMSNPVSVAQLKCAGVI